MNSPASIPLIAHVIHRLHIGGLENGLVNLINRMPRERYRHAIICMTEYTDFRKRITRDDVECYALHKHPGQDLAVYGRLWKLLRQLRPAILHTRNIGTLECVLPALCAGVPYRVHGEHGRDMADIDGSNVRYIRLRKLLSPFVNGFIALSQDLEIWLRDSVRLNPKRIVQIYNGVDVLRFQPLNRNRQALPVGFADKQSLVIGTVGRMQAEKDPLNLVQAFIQLMQDNALARQQLRLVMIGDGPLHAEANARLRSAGLGQIAWLPGARNDIPDILQALDLFVLPSLAEGISNTILEAMACGLPVVATAVGGNPELLADGETGVLIPPADSSILADAIAGYWREPDRLVEHGRAGRQRAEERFSLDAMVSNYLALYDGLLGRKSPE